MEVVRDIEACQYSTFDVLQLTAKNQFSILFCVTSTLLSSSQLLLEAELCVSITTRPSARAPIHPSVRLPAHSPIRPSVRSSVPPSIYASICLADWMKCFSLTITSCHYCCSSLFGRVRIFHPSISNYAHMH